MADNPSGSPTRPSLLLRIRDPRDAAAWKTFVDLYGPLVYHHCRGCGLQDADAAEVSQEVLLQVNRSIRRFDYRPEYGRFSDWLGTLTRHKIQRFLRKKASAMQAGAPTTATGDLDQIASPVQDPEWTDAFHAHILQSALARIRPHFEEHTWRAFQSVWLENHPAAQVARELGQKLNWVYMAKSRVLKRLQAEVEELAEERAWCVR